MAEVLTFEYDQVGDGLKVGGVDYAKGSFRGITGPVKTGVKFVVEARGGGVFHVSVPDHVVVEAPKVEAPKTVSPPGVKA